MIENHEKITKEFCKEKRLVFNPKTVQEAELIQQQIFQMGYSWGNPQLVGVTNTTECISRSMLLDDGKLYTASRSYLNETDLLCTSDQFADKYRSDRELMLEIFNRLADLSKKMDAVYEEVMPKVLKKTVPVLGKRGQQP